MPWQGKGRPPEPIYYFDGTDWVEAIVTYNANLGRYLVTFQVYHFSDWEVGPEPPY
jgi:hypothetical protein